MKNSRKLKITLISTLILIIFINNSIALFDTPNYIINKDYFNITQNITSNVNLNVIAKGNGSGALINSSISDDGSLTTFSSNVLMPTLNVTGKSTFLGNITVPYIFGKTITPVNNDDLVNKKFTDDTYLKLAGGTLTGDLFMGANKVTFGVLAGFQIYFDITGAHIKQAVGNNLFFFQSFTGYVFDNNIFVARDNKGLFLGAGNDFFLGYSPATGVTELANIGTYPRVWTGFSEYTFDNTLRFETGGGLPHAHVYGNEIMWTQASAVQNTWYPVNNSNMTSGLLKDVTHDGSGKITFLKAGVYSVNVDASLEVSAVNKHIQIGARINTTPQNALNHIEPRFANVQEPIGLNLFVNTSINGTMDIIFRTTDTGTPNILVDHLTYTVSMIGGN